MTDEQKELVKYLRAIDRHTGGGDKNEEGHAADLIELQVAEIKRLRAGYAELCRSLESGEMCKLNDTDIVWADGITTLWDYCAPFCDRPFTDAG